MGHRGAKQCAVEVEEDGAAGASAGHGVGTAGDDTEGLIREGQQEERGPDPGRSKGNEVDLEAHVEAALADIMAADGLPPAEAMEEDS